MKKLLAILVAVTIFGIASCDAVSGNHSTQDSVKVDTLTPVSVDTVGSDSAKVRKPGASGDNEKPTDNSQIMK